MRSLITLLVIYFSSISHAYSTELIKVAAASLYIDAFKKLTVNKTCGELTDDDFASSIYRGVADLIIICKAFDESALDVEFEFISVPNYARGYSMVQEGNAHINAETIWQNQHDERYFYLSEPIIRKGEFEVGIYVSPSRADLLAIKSLKELQNYTAVSQKAWVNDWALLERLKLKMLHPVSTIEQMFKMVAHDRIDFLIWTFTSNAKLSQRVGDIELFPIPNIKFIIPHSRHFAVGKTSPNAYKIFQALNAGLIQLRNKGLIRKYYSLAGFINPTVANWHDITPPE